MRGWILPVLLAVDGCRAQSVPVNGPDGEPGWFSITCRKEAACREEAGDVCPYGYEVAHESGHSGVSTTSDNPLVAAGDTISGEKKVYTTFEGSLLVKCHRRGYAAADDSTPAPTSTAAAAPTEQPVDGSRIKGRDSESGVSFSYVVPTEWKFTPTGAGDKAWSSPKSTHGAWIIVKPWGGTARDFAEKLAGDQDRSFYEAKIDGRIATMLEAHPKDGGIATSAVVAIEGTAFALTCMDVVGDETSKVCLRVLKTFRLEEP